MKRYVSPKRIYTHVKYYIRPRSELIYVISYYCTRVVHTLLYHSNSVTRVVVTADNENKTANGFLIGCKI